MNGFPRDSGVDLVVGKVLLLKLLEDGDVVMLDVAGPT
jgi:hypothetical protein